MTTYSYDAQTSMLKWVQYPEDTDETRTKYTYDSMYRMATAEATTDTGLNLSASYTYTNDLLTKIQTPTTAYNFTYGNFGLRSSVKVGTQNLATYSYTNDRNFYLQSLDYGNGDSVDYTYDSKGRLTSQTYEDGDTVTYQYDNDGALAAMVDSATGITTKYYYDFTGRTMKYTETANGYSHSVGYDYDDINNLISQVETINGVEYTTSYTYDSDNRVTSKTTDGITVTYTYDTLGRISQQVTKNGNATILTESYTYNANSSQIRTYRTVSSGYDVTYTYTYDDNGNILSISDGTNTTSYVYDSQNQLIRENNESDGTTWVYEYDDAGNIVNCGECSYSVGALPDDIVDYEYTYNHSEWGDLLTAYMGRSISYDNIGNPLNDGSWVYNWEHGRELASVSYGNTTWTYTYDANGILTKATDGTTNYTYVYNGSKLVQMTVNDDTLWFTYDAAGIPTTVTYNGIVYYYITNAQGDVMSILDASGTSVAEYEYTAWGKVLSQTGDVLHELASTNPLRYRGYVYDAETGLYYVSSRYYDPEIGRWINADNQLSTGSDLTGLNLFAYCGNNPVNRFDPTGEAWLHWIVGAAVVVGFAALTVATCGGSLALAVTSVGLVANGVAAASTATTVAAAAFIGSATVYGASVLAAASSSDSLDDFANQGNWGTVAATTFGGLTGGYDGYTMSKAQTPTSTPTGKGTQNPKVKAAVQKGQAMHKQMDYGPGVLKEQTIAPGCRVDGIDFNNRIIYELKPNNPQAIARGMSQLNRYTSAASQQFGGTWTGVLKLYD